jgi:uncharacterized protein (DUF488 family)
MASIYTIGYGNRTFQEFLRLLEQYKIKYLVDVRSKPYSRINPDFSRETIERNLTQNEIRYVYMGDVLGGVPDDPSSYTSDGHVDYEKCKIRPNYQAGIERLKSAWIQGLGIAIMCSELKPQHCHRSKLIGESLTALDIDVLHIDEVGEIKNQTQVMNEVTAEIDGAPPGQLPLFGNDVGHSLTSRKRYSIAPQKRTQSDET